MTIIDRNEFSIRLIVSGLLYSCCVRRDLKAGLEKVIEIIFPRFIRFDGTEVSKADLRICTSNLRLSTCVFFEDCVQFAIEELRTDAFLCSYCPFSREKMAEKDIDKVRRLYWSRRADRSMKGFTSESVQLIENGKIFTCEPNDRRVKIFKDDVRAMLDKYLVVDHGLKKVEGSRLLVELLRDKVDKGVPIAMFKIAGKKLSLLDIGLPSSKGGNGGSRSDIEILMSSIKSMAAKYEKSNSFFNGKDGNLYFDLGGILLPGLEISNEAARKTCTEIMTIFPELDIEILDNKALKARAKKETAVPVIQKIEVKEEFQDDERKDDPDRQDGSILLDNQKAQEPSPTNDPPAPPESIKKVVVDKKRSEGGVPSLISFETTPIKSEMLIAEAVSSLRRRYKAFPLIDRKKKDFVIFVGSSDEENEFFGYTEEAIYSLAVELSWLTCSDVQVDVIIDPDCSERETVKKFKPSAYTEILRTSKFFKRSEMRNGVGTKKARQPRVLRERAKWVKHKKPVRHFLPVDLAIQEVLDPIVSCFIKKYAKKEGGRQNFALVINGSRCDLINIDRKTARCIKLAAETKLGIEVELLSINQTGKLVLIETKGSIVRQEVERYLHPKQKKDRVLKERVSRKKPARKFLSADPCVQVTLSPITSHFTQRFSKKTKGRQDFVLVINDARYDLLNVDRKTARCVKLAAEMKLEVEVELFSINKSNKLAPISVDGSRVHREVEKYLNPRSRKERVVKERVGHKKPVREFKLPDPAVQEILNPIAGHFVQKYAKKERGQQNYILIIDGARYDLVNVDCKTARCIKLTAEIKLESTTELFSVNQVGKLAPIGVKSGGVRREVERYLRPRQPRERKIRVNTKRPRKVKVKTEYILTGDMDAGYSNLKELCAVIRRKCKEGQVGQVVVTLKATT